MAGWRFKSLPGNKTQVTYIVQSDVGGKLPTSLVNSASQQQAFMIAAVDKELSFNKYPAVELNQNALTEVAKEINSRTGPFPSTASGGASPSAFSSPASPMNNRPSGSAVVASPVSSPKPQVSFSSSTPSPSAINTVSNVSVSAGGGTGGGGGKGVLSTKSLGLLCAPSLIWFVGKVVGGGMLYNYRGVIFCFVLAYALNAIIYDQVSPLLPIKFFLNFFVVVFFFSNKKRKEKKQQMNIYIIIIIILIIYCKQLGSPSPKKCVDSEWGDSKGGVSIFRFPIELKKLLRYLESKRQNSGVEINVTHVTIKAAAIAMREFPALNGRVCLLQFYRSSERPSIAYLNPSVGDYLSATLVDNADLKAVDAVARELKSGVESAMVS
jgi:hypothetical protein